MRDALLDRLAACLVGPRLVVAVDGPDAAGKTTFADALAERVGAARLSADDYLNPASVRKRRGELSPEGCYLDSFDSSAVRAAVAASSGVVVVDGVFLLRPELRDLWDLTVHLHVPPSVTLARALVRDAPLMGGPEEVERRYTSRYLPAQDLYRAEVDPLRCADVVLDNSEPSDPRVLRWELP